MSFAPSASTSYWRVTRAHTYSLLFALPLLVFYELLALLIADDTGGIRNAADVILKSFFIALAGSHGPVLFGAVLICAVATLLVGVAPQPFVEMLRACVIRLP